MIATVGLWDIENCEAFVGRTLSKWRGRLSRDERDELMCEGLVILTQLASKYEAHMDGYTQEGRFSGYAAQLLPRRLQDAFYRLHPEHHVTRGPDGARVYEFAPPAMSIDSDDFRQLTATSTPTSVLGNPTHAHHNLGETVDAALQSLPVWERLGAQRVMQLMDAGYEVDEVARLTSLGRREVSRLRDCVGAAIAAAEPWRVKQTAA